MCVGERRSAPKVVWLEKDNRRWKMAHKIREPMQFSQIENNNKSRVSKNTKIISLIIITLIVLATVSIFILFKNEGSASITSVEINPESPVSGDTIKIYANLDQSLNFRKPRFTYTTFFYTGQDAMGGSFPMTKLSGEKYFAEIGPYDEGVQIWYMITLLSNNGISYNESTLDIGDVQYSDPISIYGVDFSPKNLENCDSINITAEYKVNRVFTEQHMTYEVYYVFTPDGHSSSMFDTLSGINLNYTAQTGQYQFRIRCNEGLYSPTETPEYKPFPSKSLIFYRIYIVGVGNDFKYATPSYVITIP